ncbi:hypothetical protein BMW26_14435 [Microbacterium sp. 1.5R]|nr:hypothetical protein BMW26_14435 [Microbacterium sp. 1.5R]
MRVLVAPDKFKGCLTAAEVADAIAEGIAIAPGGSGAPDAPRVQTLPLADGGDGSVSAAIRAGFTAIPVEVTGPDGQQVAAVIAFDGSTAVVEVAAVSGLAMLGDRRDAIGTTSRGVGDAIRSALDVGATRIIIALGGSATTDGGAGMLSALGVRFLTRDGVPVAPTGGNLGDVDHLDVTGLIPLHNVELVAACDVRNPLLGPVGAAAVFAPQKGADEAEVDMLERNLSHLVGLLSAAGRPDAADLAGADGAGSAGGIAFALALLGGELVSGADLFLDLLDYDALVRENDVIVTGEGSLDAQTGQGKLIAAVARRAHGRPVIAVVGRSELSDEEIERLGIREVHALVAMSDADTRSASALSRELLTLVGTRIAGHPR